MLYQSLDYPKVSKLSLYACNFDLILDCVPVASTITNVTRLVFKVLGIVMQKAMLCAMYTALPFAWTAIALSLCDEKAEKMKRLYWHIGALSSRIESLCYSNFFINHYTSKSLARCVLDSMPLLGNFACFVACAPKDYNFQKQVLLKTLQDKTPSSETRIACPYLSWANHSILPEAFYLDKEIHLANAKLSFKHVERIPESLFADEAFVDSLFNIFTSEHYHKESAFLKQEFQKVALSVIQKAQKQGSLLKIPMPLYLHTLPESFEAIIELVQAYPIILWLLPNIEFIQNKRYLIPIIQRYPQVVNVLSEHFLKMNRSLFIKALTLKDELVFGFDDAFLCTILARCESSSESLLTRLCSLKKSLSAHLRKLQEKRHQAKEFMVM